MSKIPLSKQQLAEKLGVSTSVLRKWLNVDFFKELASMGYKKNQKVLTPKQVKYLLEELD